MGTARLSRRVLLGGLPLAGLGACRGDRDIVAPGCPPALIVEETRSVTRFRPGGGRDLTDVEAQAEIGAAVAECAPRGGGLSVNAAMRLAAALGPAARERRLRLPYFIAVVEDGRTVLARETREVALEFRPSQQRLEAVEQVELRLPAVRRGREQAYSVMMGLMLTPDELAYNRSRQR